MATYTQSEREKIIVKTSITGIAVNVLLAGAKAAVGLITNSIAVTLDAVNNLSDALSSIITIVGAKLAAKLPDKKHPLGYGRIEYMSAMIVAAIVLYAGITSAVESVKKIISPEKAEYTVVSLVMIAAAVGVKLILGTYVKKQGERVNSAALEASGKDALSDAVLSVSVLASALVFLLTGLSLEAFVGLVISVFIIRAGLEMLSETLDDILGKRADSELTATIKAIINEEPEVRGAYDLILNNYGPDKNIGSVHIELDDTMSVRELDGLTRRLEEKVYERTGVILTGVGVYSYNTGNDAAAELRNEVIKTVLSHEWALQVHGFYADTDEKKMRLDVVMSFDISSKEGKEIITKELCDKFPGYDISVSPDVYITDIEESED
ncbi:MAG: cation transporter [Oscillospiraceae bacterium]|nr:cation transporter [Oscillospiraceae bacterium]